MSPLELLDLVLEPKLGEQVEGLLERPGMRLSIDGSSVARFSGSSRIARGSRSSRSGITMVGGLWRGLNYEDAARFAFLLATPVILAVGVLKLPSLFGKAGDNIHAPSVGAWPLVRLRPPVHRGAGRGFGDPNRSWMRSLR